LGMLCFRDMPPFNHIPIKKSRSFSRLFPRIAIIDNKINSNTNDATWEGSLEHFSKVVSE
jgi:hypothetical protein